MTITKLQTSQSELRGLLALALQHLRRSSTSPWVSLSLGDLKVSIRAQRNYAIHIHVLLAPKEAWPSIAHEQYVIESLGLKPYRREDWPLWGASAARLLVSTDYDARNPNAL